MIGGVALGVSVGVLPGITAGMLMALDAAVHLSTCRASMR
jgi:hypothetical protein